MTNEQKQILRDMTPEAPANDLIGYIEDIILDGKSKMSEEEIIAIKTKAEYWFMAALNKGYIIGADQIYEMVRKTLEVADEQAG